MVIAVCHIANKDDDDNEKLPAIKCDRLCFQTDADLSMPMFHAVLARSVQTVPPDDSIFIIQTAVVQCF